MPTLDIWSNSATWRLQGLIQSALACLLACRKIDRVIYLCSPWISDFPVFDNSLGQFSVLVPRASDRARIYLSDCLVQLSEHQEIRIVTKRTTSSETFCKIPALRRERVKVRLGDDKLHEKGFLTPLFYLEGSMNVTYSGVMLNSEKVVFHSGKEPVTAGRIGNAYLEFNRRWDLLKS